MIHFRKQIKIVVDLEHREEIRKIIMDREIFSTLNVKEFLDVYIVMGMIDMEYYQSLINTLEKLPFDVLLDI